MVVLIDIVRKGNNKWGTRNEKGKKSKFCGKRGWDRGGVNKRDDIMGKQMPLRGEDQEYGGRKRSTNKSAKTVKYNAVKKVCKYMNS